jgi:hypothetical protein
MLLLFLNMSGIALRECCMKHLYIMLCQQDNDVAARETLQPQG